MRIKTLKLNGKTVISLDRFFREEGKGLHELLGDRQGDPLDEILKKEVEEEQIEKIKKALSILSPREKFVIRGWQEEKPLREIGEKIGLSIEGVRKIQTKSLSKLKIYFGQNNYSDLPLFQIN